MENDTLHATRGPRIIALRTAQDCRKKANIMPLIKEISHRETVAKIEIPGQWQITDFIPARLKSALPSNMLRARADPHAFE